MPGIPLAIARPDLIITLVEPMLRRTEFLDFALKDLRLAGVDVRRGRAEDPGIRSAVSDADVVVSRAVSGLTAVARWSLPLLRPGGRVLALKGDRAEAEVAESRDDVAAMGGVEVDVVRCGREYLTTPATVVVVIRGHRMPARTRPRKRPSKPGQARAERRGP